ncbi:MAG: hypothetical protein GX181_02250 [Synergistaceae bacterium]|nr:hypothetical protein [Synergistota bacterium]NLM70769.1 hypothetical protein [Synergistaceae bacterium]
MYISSDRTFGRSFTILLALSFILAGLSGVIFLLVAPESRTGNFWISFWAILFTLVLSFAYLIFHVVTGRDSFAPVPLMMGLSTTLTVYSLFVLGDVLFSLFYPRLSSEVYLASHVTGFVVLVGGGGIMTLLSLTAKEADMNASLKRSRLFVQRTRLGSLVDELGLSPFSKQASELIASLKNLRGTIESKDPSAPGGVEIEELLVLAVDEVERKARHFMAAGSVEERDALLADAAILVEKAFNALHRREGVQEAE